MSAKEIIRKHCFFLSFIYRLIFCNRIKVKRGNLLKYKGTFLRNCEITISGYNNTVFIDPGITRLYHCKIQVLSSNNSIRIGSDSNLHCTSLYIEDDGSTISIGKHVTITGKTNIDLIEGKDVSIGDDCLFSSQIQIRVGDSHSILDIDTKNRINPSKDVIIGNHVWVGNNVDILKGAIVSDNSIIGARSVLTGHKYPPNCIIAGVPAKIIRENVNWFHKRIQMNQE